VQFLKKAIKRSMKKYIIAAALIMEPVHYHHHCTILYNLATSDMGLSIIKRMLFNGIDKGVAFTPTKKPSCKIIWWTKPFQKSLETSTLCWKKFTISGSQRKRLYCPGSSLYRQYLETDPTGRCKQPECTRCNKNYTGNHCYTDPERKNITTAYCSHRSKVDEKLNEYGIVKTINTALSGSNFLGNLLGGNKTQ
jgi:hypothetical protein